MADNREIRHTLKRIQSIKTWQLVVLLVMVGFIALTFLRLNNVGMIERRDAVHAADIAGDDADLQRRLYDLQRYVSAHMNTDPGRVDLPKAYERDNQALKAQLEVTSESNPNGNIFKKANEVCDAVGRQNGWRSWGDPRMNTCLEQEYAKYPASNELASQFKPLSPDPYYHTFVSPLWTPDFAGWSILVFAVILLVIIFRLVTLLVLNLILKYRYRKI